MAPLAGLTGLYGPSEAPHGQTGRDPANWGGPADQRHAVPGDSVRETLYLGTAYSQDPQLPGAAPTGTGGPAGQVIDHTPRVHSAPYPRGIETDPVAAADASAQLHGYDLGGVGFLYDGPIPYPVHVESGFHLSPERSMLAAGTPGQLRGGSKDVDQGDGQANSGTFAYGHQYRIAYTDPIPMTATNLNGGERPFYGKHPVWQARLDGDGSPYGVAGDTSVDMNLAPTPVGFPTPYEQPANPTVAPATTYPGAAGVPDYGWVAG